MAASAPTRFKPSPRGADPAPAAPRGPSAWRRCAKHAHLPSRSVCPACGVGWCGECGQAVRSAVLCPECGGLCVPTSDFLAREELERQRSTPLFGEIATIFRYPLTDLMALGLLAVVVWIFTIVRMLSFGFFGAIVGLLFSKGLLMAYAFNALLKVSNGQMKGFIPEISDLGDLWLPLRQSVAAVVASWWPVGLAIVLAPSILGMSALSIIGDNDPTPVVHAQDYADEEAPTPDPVDRFLAEAGIDEDGNPVNPMAGTPFSGMEGSAAQAVARPLAVLALLFVGILWGIIYSPIALIVAAMARDEGFIGGFLQPLNPLNSFRAVVRMGPTYWQALAIYLALVIGELILGLLIGWIPILGGMLGAWIACYTHLAIGCTLGLAVFKKAAELGLD